MIASLDTQRRLLQSAKRAEALARQIAADTERDARDDPDAVERAQRAKAILGRAEDLTAQVTESLARIEARYLQAQAGIHLAKIDTARQTPERPQPPADRPDAGAGE